MTVTGADGSRVRDGYRLITTLMDHRRFPAAAVIRLYHERWEIESAYFALRHTLLNGRVLRSGDRPGLEQETWALLSLYQLLRMAMVTAVETRPGTDPDRASFTTAMETAKDQLTAAAGICPDGPADLPGVIGRAVLATLLPARRLRFSARKVKCATSRYWKPGAVKLAAHPTFHPSGFQAAWMSWTAIGEAAARAGTVDGYLDAVILKAAAGRAAVEGAVHAAVSSFDPANRVMLDREVLLHFRDTPTKQRVMDSVIADLRLALSTAPMPGARPAAFGGRCGLLAIDSAGRLLAVEVKPKGAPTITWAPAQAIVYARLFNIWLQHDPDAAEILSGMIEQRKRLNLIKSQTPVLPSRPGVIPIVAVQRGVSQELRDRLFTVRRHLTDQGIDEALQLRVYEVTLAGRLLPANGSHGLRVSKRNSRQQRMPRRVHTM